MRTNTNWEFVEAAGNFVKIPAGGYVLRITDVKDVPSSEKLEIEYEVHEGDNKDFFKKNKSAGWVHTHKCNYGERSASFFKRFLEALEDSNDNFSIAEWNKRQDEREFIGLLFGGLIQEYFYTDQKTGKDKSGMEITREVSIYDIRGGFYTLPEPRDDREHVAPSKDVQGGSDLYDDVPFTRN